MSFPRYERRKESGVPWLGQVPDHWEVKRIKHLIRSLEQGWSPQCESSPAESPDEWAVLKVGCVNGGSFQPTQNKALPADLEPVPSLGVIAGDVLISRANTRELVGSAAVALADYPKLMVCDKLYRIRLKPRDCKSEFLASYLGTCAVRGQIELSATGASSSMLNIGQDTILDMPIALPPFREQLAIMSFLDRETAKIDALVDEQTRLIELLKEKRQAVISHAVTKGLDPNAPMKDSGVEWLGQVPEHWEVRRIGRLFSEAAEEGLDELPVLSVSIHDGVSDKELSDDEADRKITRSEDRTKYKRVQPNDLVYNMMRAWQGGFGTVQVDGMVSPAYVVARPRSAIQTRFVEHLLRTPQAVEEMRRHSHGVTDFRLRLYWDEFKNIRLAIPPLRQQQQILTFIDDHDVRAAGLMATAEHSIALLQERRAALISGAVTGKIDVRGAASLAAEAA
jgi:type I restriction enzyme S subunit